MVFIASISFAFVISAQCKCCVQQELLLFSLRYILAGGQTPNGSMVGLALSQAMVLTGMLQYGMKQTAEVINQLTSVERVLQYTKLENEGPFETPKGNSYPALLL